MYSNGLIDGIIPEPLGGAHRDPTKMAETIKDQIIKDIVDLNKKQVDKLVNDRIEKFCAMGVVVE
jgi:acetyl-CoA carboxylase carboxyl transferase subunit alpha